MGWPSKFRITKRPGWFRQTLPMGACRHGWYGAGRAVSCCARRLPAPPGGAGASAPFGGAKIAAIWATTWAFTPHRARRAACSRPGGRPLPRPLLSAPGAAPGRRCAAAGSWSAAPPPPPSRFPQRPLHSPLRNASSPLTCAGGARAGAAAVWAATSSAPLVSVWRRAVGSLTWMPSRSAGSVAAGANGKAVPSRTRAAAACGQTCSAAGLIPHRGGQSPAPQRGQVA